MKGSITMKRCLTLAFALFASTLYAQTPVPQTELNLYGAQMSPIFGQAATVYSAGTPNGWTPEVEVSLTRLNHFAGCTAGINTKASQLNYNTCKGIAKPYGFSGGCGVICAADVSAKDDGLPHFNIWGATSKHWQIDPGGIWHLYATRTISLDFGQAPPCGSPPTLGCQPNTPIVLPTRAIAYVRFTDVTHGVPFDLDGDGVLEMVAWPKNGAWLAIDLDGDGAITSGKELFGDHTNGQHWATGFEALTHLMALGNLDANIDVDDPIYSRLLIWEDENHDGISTPDELTPFSSEFKAIGLGYTTSNWVDANGTAYRYQGFADRYTVGANTREIKVFDVIPVTDELP